MTKELKANTTLSHYRIVARKWDLTISQSETQGSDPDGLTYLRLHCSPRKTLN
jgi:hypothetical protein